MNTTNTRLWEKWGEIVGGGVKPGTLNIVGGGTLSERITCKTCIPKDKIKVGENYILLQLNYISTSIEKEIRITNIRGPHVSYIVVSESYHFSSTLLLPAYGVHSKWGMAGWGLRQIV